MTLEREKNKQKLAEINKMILERWNEFNIIKKELVDSNVELQELEDMQNNMKVLELNIKIEKQNGIVLQQQICQKREIQHILFHKETVAFVQRVRDFQENRRIISLINEKMTAGKKMLEIYNEKLASSKRGIVKPWNPINQISNIPLIIPPSPALSIASNTTQKGKYVY